MTRASHVFYLLLTIHMICFMSQQVSGQSPMDNDPFALEYELDTTTTTTVTGTAANSDILLDDNEQLLLPDTDLLEQDMDDDNEDETDDEEDDYDTYDTTSPPPSMDNYYRLLGQGDSKEQEQGDELGEELLVEYDEDDDGNNSNNHDGLMFEDDEDDEPLDFKNDEQMDLDQLLFDASQKDYTSTTTMMDYEDDLSTASTNDDAIDELLSHADDALVVDPLDETSPDGEHPDHDNNNEGIQVQQPPNDDDDGDRLLPPPPSSNIGGSSSPLPIEKPSTNTHHQYKLPLFGVLALLILLYKVSNKKQGGRIKCMEKEEKGLPLHSKDLKIPDIGVDSSILVESSQASPLGTTTTQPTTTGGHSQHLGRRASSSSFYSPRQANSTSGGGGGHARKISLGQYPMVATQSKYRQ